MDPQAVLDFLTPRLIVAGDYANRVQPRVHSTTEKGGNIFQSVLTDADLSIQNYFEVSLLSAFPEVRFFGEEHEKSFNTHYFPEDGKYTITLDPVNGTRLFVDQFDTFDIILCLIEDDVPLAAVTYLPRRGTFYAAIRGRGAFTFSRQEVQKKALWKPLVLSPGEEKIMTFRDKEVLSLLLGNHIEAVDLIEQYTASPSSLTLNSLFTGELAGWVRRHAPLIDLGAIGFIAHEAGALVTDFTGQEIPPYSRENGYHVPELAVACSPRLHEAIINSIKGLRTPSL